jgi:hypothetical protein
LLLLLLFLTVELDFLLVLEDLVVELAPPAIFSNCALLSSFPLPLVLISMLFLLFLFGIGRRTLFGAARPLLSLARGLAISGGCCCC